MKTEVDPTDAPRIGFHQFLNLNAGIFQVRLHVAGLNAHNGEHTTAQRGGHQVAWRKSFGFALVIERRIGFYLGAGRKVPGNRSEFSLVNNSRGHVFFHKFTAVILIMALKKLLFLVCFSTATFTLLAQQSPSPNYNSSRNAAKKDRINRMMKMEEEGDLVFDHHSAFGLRIATDGYGIFYERGKFKSVRKTRLLQFELNEKKDPKDHKVAVGGFNGYTLNSIAIGRLNNFYQFKAAIGEQYLIGGKGNKNGVAVTALYTGGVSVGILKPYLLHVYKSQNNNDLSTSSYPEVLDSGYLVNDALGFGSGWDKLSIKPGLNAKTAIRFDYGRFNQNVTAIEVGVTAEYYFSKIPLDYLVTQKQLFFNAYISIMFGKRK